MLKAISELGLSPTGALGLAVVLALIVLVVALSAGRRAGRDRARNQKQPEVAQATEAPDETAATDQEEEPKLFSLDYLLFLVGGSGIIIGSIIIAKTGSAFLLSSAVPLIASGLAFIALGYATVLLKRTLKHSRRSRSDAPRADGRDPASGDWPVPVPKLSSAPSLPSRQKQPSPQHQVQKGFYRDHPVIVHANGQVDAKLKSGWKRFASLDELDKYVSSARYRHGL